jgi:hypothetical protein
MAGKAWLGLLTPNTHVFSQTDSLYSRILAFPHVPSGTIVILKIAKYDSKTSAIILYLTYIHSHTDIICAVKQNICMLWSVGKPCTGLIPGANYRN